MRQSKLMQVLRYTLFNPLGIALTVMHWIVVAFAMLGDIPEGWGYYHGLTRLQMYLIVANLPAFAVSHLVAAPVIYLLGLGDGANYIYPVLSVFFCTAQWLIIGTLLHFLISQHFPKSDSPSVTPRST